MAPCSLLPEKQHSICEVVAGILWRNDEFLACKRPVGSPRSGFWEFPGGKVETQETLEQALERELVEELGIQVIACNFWHSVEHQYPDLLVRLHFFYVTLFTGEPQPLIGQSLAWMTASTTQANTFLEADRPLLALLREQEALR